MALTVASCLPQTREPDEAMYINRIIFLETGGCTRRRRHSVGVETPRLASLAPDGLPSHVSVCMDLQLHTVAGVPGMVAAVLRHLNSLRNMKRDHGACDSLSTHGPLPGTWVHPACACRL
jgi:hypothetical protein